MPGSKKKSRKNSRRPVGTVMSAVPIVMKRVSVDPPTIKPTNQVTVNLMLTQTSAAGTYTLTGSVLKTLIDDQLYASTTAFARYTINSIRAWGQAGTGVAISIADEKYGITAADTGSYTFRPKVGLFFPPHIRTPTSTSSTDTVATFTLSPDAANFCVLTNVTIWTVSKVDF